MLVELNFRNKFCKQIQSAAQTLLHETFLEKLIDVSTHEICSALKSLEIPKYLDYTEHALFSIFMIIENFICFRVDSEV